MGLFDKALTKSQIQPVPVQVGEDWYGQVMAEVPMFRGFDLLRLPAIAAVLAVDPGIATSSYAMPGETRIGAGAELVRSSLCVLRAGSLFGVAAGVPSPGYFTTDWRIDLADGPGAGASKLLTVPECRTLDNKLVNFDLLDKTRHTFANALQHGPGEVRLEAGPPKVDGLISVGASPLTDGYSPFANDYRLPIPAGFADGIEIPIHDEEAAAVEQALSQLSWPSAGRPRSIDLRGGRAADSGTITFAEDAGRTTLRLELPAQPEWDQQRTFRAAMIALNELSGLASESAPATARALHDHVDALTANLRKEERVSSLTPHWDGKTAAEMVVIRPQMTLPIAVVVRGRGINPWAAHEAAQAWLLSLERTFTHGVRQTTREGNRLYMRRGSLREARNEKALNARVRYAHTGSAALTDFPASSEFDQVSWFWETWVDSKDLESGETQGLLVVSGISRVQGVLSYGAELLHLLRAFVACVQSQNPDAEVSTATLTVR